jgi:exodeoxyribonuclease V alpha subunit
MKAHPDYEQATPVFCGKKIEGDVTCGPRWNGCTALMARGLFDPPTKPGAALATVEGTLERVTYVNEENGWSVVKVHVPGRADPVTAVGSLLGAQPGESLRLSGRWVQDKKYGEQLRVESYLTVKPATLVGMEKYLGSGLVRGVGKVMAARLVKHFEFATLDIIDQDPDRLTEVDGIGPKRKARVIAAWAEQKAVKEVMLFLQSHGVSTTFAVKIYKQYKDRAIAVVKENPYQLAVDIFGIGFKTADKIAADLGISPTSPRRAEAGVLHVLGELSSEGHVYCPHDQLVESATAILEIEAPIIEMAITSLSALGLVVGELLAPGQPVYLKSLHISEQGSAERIHTVLAVPAAPITVDVDRAISWFEEQQKIALAEQQKAAIRRAVTGKVLVITGGPGTGKTTLVNGIIRILEKKGRRILLCAPTGRAAKRMAETTGHEAKTIHRLLEFNPRGMCFDRNIERPLEADLLIVDEMSMVDTVLFYNLLKAVPPACQLILVGDVDQLPSVGPGSVLRDVIQSGVTEVVTLTEIFRQAQQSLIIVNAHRVNQGQQPLGIKGANADDEAPTTEPDFFFFERDEPEAVLATLKELVARRIPTHFKVNALEDIQVLTPMHRGLLGSLSVNAELQALLNPEGESFVRGSRVYRVGDKVMQIRNNYELEVFNGDIGRVVKIDAEERQVEVRFEERVVTYDTADLDELVLGYACSIHKSQGSEYPVVVLPLHTQHYVMLQRNLLYTGITRGRKLVVIIGSRRAMAIAVKNDRIDARYTRLTERLKERVG